jgi:hypothetical protein
VRAIFSFLILFFYVAGIYPSAALATTNAVKVKVTHSHGHSHDKGHSHHHHSDDCNHAKEKAGDSHSHEVVVSGPNASHIGARQWTFFAPFTTITSILPVELHSQLGQRLSSIFRPPIS